MKLSDYIAEFLAKEDVKHTFGITGGVITHVLDSIDKNPYIQHICTQHEQAAAMAADAYSRISENIGVGITTSGPGATNLITGVCCSYFDSIPTLFITGQVSRAHLKTGFNVRQIGFQETDISSLFSSITKYAKLVENPEEIKYELEKAFYIARTGRPGPVVLDIPEDLHWKNIEPSKLKEYSPQKIKKDLEKLEEKINQAVDLLENSKRPVIILGGGVKLAKAADKAKDLVERLNFPVALTWATKDMFSYDYPLVIEGFGVSSERAGNFAVQNSDLILALGTRLDTHEAGSNPSTFAREAKKIVVDIDYGELEKYRRKGMNVDILFNYDVNDFLDSISKRKINAGDISGWLSRINQWKEKYPICLPEYFSQSDKVNPYVFMDILSKESEEGDIIITDAGGNLTWTMQGYRVKKNQRLFSAFNHSPMGYSLPASIGAYFASKKPISCIIGDGGIQMNIQELATIEKHNLPIKIFLLNNNGYGIIQQTQDTWMNSRYVASNPDSGVAVPDFISIAKAYHIPSFSIKNHSGLRKGIRKSFKLYNGPVLCNIEVEQHQKITPKLEFGKPIEDSSPLLERKEFYENMIVKPL